MRIDSPAAFEDLYKQYHAAIYRYCYRYCQESELALDLTSTVFERAWKSRRRFSGSYPRAWLYRIARNLLIDYWRKRKDLPMEDMASFADNISAPPDHDRDLFLWQLGKSLDHLPANYKSVIVLRFIDDLSVSEVAAILDLTEANVRVLQFRALQKLKRVLKDEK